MKKVSLFYNQDLIEALEDPDDRDYRESGIIGNGLGLVAYVTEMATTGIIPNMRAFEAFSSEVDKQLLNPNAETLRGLRQAYEYAGRIEVSLWTDKQRFALGVHFAFLPKGKAVCSRVDLLPNVTGFKVDGSRHEAILELHGRVDSQYVRILRKVI